MTALLDRGWGVVVLDNLVTSRRDLLEPLRARAGFEFIEHDVTNEVAVEGEVTHVLHLASPASPVDFSAIPIQIVKAGTLGTHNLLGLARVNGARFLLASTSEVYGDPLVHPQPEIGLHPLYHSGKRSLATA